MNRLFFKFKCPIGFTKCIMSVLNWEQGSGYEIK